MHASGPLVPSHAVSSQAPSSRARKLLVGGLSVLLAGSLFAPATDALAAPRPKPPSQQDVDKAQADARDKASQVKAIQAKLDAANAQLDNLNTAAETAAEDYNGAMLLVEQAQQESDAAQAKVVQAKQATAEMQDKMGAFAAASYRGQDKLAKLDALLNPDNAVNVMTRMSTLSTIARQQGDVLTDLRAAQTEQQVVQRQAAQALDAVTKAKDDAAKAKAKADAAVASQVSQLTAIQQQTEDLQAQLEVLQGRAKSLAAARQAELERQRKEREAAERAAREAQARASRDSSRAPIEYTSSGGQSVSNSAAAAKAVAFARAQIGIWYRTAGKGDVGLTYTSSGWQNVPGYDCSGLTSMAWRAAGVYIPSYSRAQWNVGVHVSRDQLQPGDLVFFASNTSNPSTIHHVGIYIGGGQMIEAPHTGTQVRVANAFRSGYIGAVRP